MNGFRIVCLAFISLAIGMVAVADQRAVIRLPLSSAAVDVDGRISSDEYGDAVILDGAFGTWGIPSPLNPSPMIYLKRTADRLFIAYDNPLPTGERPLMKGAIPDNSGICADNAMEIYILPNLKPGSLVSFIQVAGNPRGCIYDTWVTPQIGVSDVAGFTIPWLFKNSLVPEHWYSELSATFDQMRFWSAKDGDSFDIDLCRDGGFGAGGASGYMCTWAGIAAGTGAKVILDDKAPIVQWHSFGDFPDNKFNPKLVMKSSGASGNYHVSEVVTEATPDPVTSKYKELFSKKFDVNLSPGESKTCESAYDLQPASKGIATYTIVDDKGDVIFHRTVPFTTSNPYRHYRAQNNPKPLVVKAEMAPSYGRILATVDVIDFPGDKSQLEVQAMAYRDGSDAPIGKVTISRFPYDCGQGIIDVGQLTEGKYTVKFQAVNRLDKKPVGEESVELTRKVYEWENNTIGYSDKVPDPWTSMRVVNDKAVCWGREYSFNGLALPSSILTLQPEPARGARIKDVLAGPVRVVAERGGKELKWKLGQKRITSAKDTQIDLIGSAESNGLRVEVNGSLEYDGLYKIHLKMIPTQPIQLDSVRVDVPVPTNIALLLNHSAEAMRTNKTFANIEGAKDGVIWNSKDAAHNAMVKGNFLPVFWIGDDDRGLAWMCDSDRTWVTTFDKPCLDVVRNGRTTSFRMHLMNKPGVLNKPIEVTFSLQATPVRPRPEGGSWKQVQWYGWSQFDKPLIWDKCFDDYEQGKGYKWYLTDDAKKNDLWWRYFCFNSDRISKDDPVYAGMVKDFGAEWYVDAPLAQVQNKLHSDFILWAYKQWHDRAGLKGVYHDNCHAVAWPGLINNTGWIDDDGNLRAGYWVFAYREFAKRERTYWTSVCKSPVMKTHMTDSPIPGYLGFCDFWLDGENGGYPDASVKDPDFVDRWYNAAGMANLRITMGRQWGVMPQYLYNWGIDPTQTVLGQFDIDNCYSRLNGIGWEFGIDQADCRFMPFWDTRKPAQVVKGGPDVLVGTWSRPKRARILISNCSGEGRTVDVKVNAKLLRLPANSVAVDEQTGDPVAYSNGVVTGVSVDRHDYRAVIVAAPGTFAPAPSASDDLVQGKRITRLCSDFSSTKGWKLLGPNTGSWNGMLRIQGSEYALGSMPFGEDNCSVQVKVRGGNGTWGSLFWDAYPGIQLHWKAGTYVAMTAGYGQPEPDGRCHRSIISIDGKLQNRPLGPKMRTVNWLRITLKPDVIEFYSSTDGKAWVRVDSVERKGFEGAPAYLYVGRGTVAGPGELVQGKDRGNGTACFDDLVTWR